MEIIIGPNPIADNWIVRKFFNRINKHWNIPFKYKYFLNKSKKPKVLYIDAIKTNFFNYYEMKYWGKNDIRY